MGDNGTGSGGSWEIKDKVVVCSDNITVGRDKARVDKICELIKNAGKEAISGMVNPSSPYYMNSAHNNCTIFSIVGGVCWGTALDYKYTLSSQLKSKGNNIVWGFLTGDGGACEVTGEDGVTGCKHYSHDWVYGDICKSEDRQKTVDKVIEEYGGWVAGPSAEVLTNSFLTGKGAGGGAGGSTGVAVEGMLNAGKGTTPQFWNAQNYTPPTEIMFSNFEITDENPRIKTAWFETTEDIPMMSGRVAVLITGDCNDFGGIIIEKTYDPKTMLYKYQCQGFMDRIMANPIYAVCNGSKTVHEIITEVLADLGLPDINLKTADYYDRAVTDETKYLMQADKDLAETSDIQTMDTDTTKEIDKDKKTTTGTSESAGENDDVIKTVTKTKSSTKDEKIKNTLKRKPVGLYDKDTIGDFIRTLLYDYGINLDFYGDINGIPHFDVMDLEAWQKVGWYVGPDLGLGSDYQYSFKITNIITQVGIKNVQASNGNGEMYTSEELLGINLENYVGRMGVILDNPTTKSTSDAQTVDQIKEEYQDATGRKYQKTEVLNTNGEPSCKQCTYKNGGIQPAQQRYEKSWVNKCPSCDKEGILEDKSENNDYKTVCKECGKTFCQYCGYERQLGKLQLTELFRISEKTSKEKSDSNNDSDDSNSDDKDEDKTDS